MSEPAPEPAPFPWLPAARVRRWLKKAAGTDVEDVRLPAADYTETLAVGIDFTDPTAVPERIIQAGVLIAARLSARQGSPAGLASYAEFGAVEVLRTDPDVARLLELGPFAPPRVG